MVSHEFQIADDNEILKRLGMHKCRKQVKKSLAWLMTAVCGPKELCQARVVGVEKRYHCFSAHGASLLVSRLLSVSEVLPGHGRSGAYENPPFSPCRLLMTGFTGAAGSGAHTASTSRGAYSRRRRRIDVLVVALVPYLLLLRVFAYVTPSVQAA